MKLSKEQIRCYSAMDGALEEEGQVYIPTADFQELCSMAQKWAEVEALASSGGAREVAETIVGIVRDCAPNMESEVANLIAAYTLKERGEVVFECDMKVKEHVDGLASWGWVEPIFAPELKPCIGKRVRVTLSLQKEPTEDKKHD
jgi:hypothetical protein